MADKIQIICRRSGVIVCVKPKGVLSQDNGTDMCMPALLRAETGSGYIATIHRLDRVVFGLMAYAETRDAAAALSGSGLEKTYMAVIKGKPFEIEGEMRDLLFHDRSKNKSYTVKRMRRGVREAALIYKVLGSVETDGGALSLVSVRLTTGRTHQIRVQFASRKMPVFGDRKYGGGEGHIALMCQSLKFKDPKTGDICSYSMEKPDIFPWNLF